MSVMTDQESDVPHTLPPKIRFGSIMPSSQLVGSIPPLDLNSVNASGYEKMERIQENLTVAATEYDSQFRFLSVREETLLRSGSNSSPSDESRRLFNRFHNARMSDDKRVRRVDFHQLRREVRQRPRGSSILDMIKSNNNSASVGGESLLGRNVDLVQELTAKSQNSGRSNVNANASGSNPLIPIGESVEENDGVRSSADSEEEEDALDGFVLSK